MYGGAGLGVGEDHNAASGPVSNRAPDETLEGAIDSPALLVHGREGDVLSIL